VTHRTPKQVKTNQRVGAYRARRKKHRLNLIDYFNVPIDRDTQDLFGITDKDRQQNRKLIGEVIGEEVRKLMQVVFVDLLHVLGITEKDHKKAIQKLMSVLRGKDFRNALRSIHGGRSSRCLRQRRTIDHNKWHSSAHDPGMRARGRCRS
jgi:hypothetical protein